MKKEGKAKLQNGRDKKPLPSFENWHCRIFPKDMTYSSWKYLSKSSTDIANICRAKNDHAGAKNGKENGRPVFSFTANEAERDFKFTRPTFSASMKQLLEIGFLKVIHPGGILDGKGIPARYQLIEEWKHWEPPARDNSNITKARSLRKK
jgi:hypothetical protein